MNTSRETIYSSLFTLLSNALTSLGFITLSRHPANWTNVAPEDQPAMFMQQISEKAIVLPSPAPPTKWELLVDVVLYVNVGSDPTALSSTLLNAAVDAIESRIPIGIKVQNLGLQGVIEVRINGNVEYALGSLAEQGIALVPIRIVAV